MNFFIKNKLLLLFFVIMFAVGIKSYALEDTIIAIVNDDIVTLNELKDYMDSLYMRLRAQGLSDFEIQEKMLAYQEDGLNKLIEEKLLIDEAESKEMVVRAKLIEEKLDKVRNKYSSEKDFLDAVVAEGLTITDLKNKIEDDLKVKYIIEMEVKNKIFVNPNEVTAYYENNPEEFVKPERLKLESIGITLEDDSALAQKKATEAMALLKKGEDFQEVAEQYSDLPSLGIIAKDQLLPKIEDTIFRLKKNEISPSIRTETAIFIVKLIERYPSEPATIDETKDHIYQMLFQKKYRERLRRWVDKLKKDAYIEIKG